MTHVDFAQVEQNLQKLEFHIYTIMGAIISWGWGGGGGGYNGKDTNN